METILERNAIRRRVRRLTITLCLAVYVPTGALGQKTLTWEEAKRELEASNPTLRAARIGIQESRADEITAYLRPNPDLTVSADQFNPFTGNPYRPFGDVLPFVSSTYLVERRHKRELRRESAQGSTAIAVSQLADQERSLLFDLRTAFVAVLQQKSVLAVTRESLDYYDRSLTVSRERYKAGDIARVDLDRMELQRVQFETDVQTALVNLRTAKIQLEELLNDRTPVEQLDVIGRFDYAEILTPLEEFRQSAFAARPDLRAALQGVDKARTDHRLAVANGSTDPTFGVDLARDPPDPGVYRFQCEHSAAHFRPQPGRKGAHPTRHRAQRAAGRSHPRADIQRCRLGICHAAEQPDTAAPLQSGLSPQAARVRETISFSYQHGGASLLDFLQAQQDYRGIQLSYLNLVGSYLSAASQLNLAVGREVIQ